MNTERIFYYFEKLNQIPRGSGDVSKAADFLEDFAKEHSLKCRRDTADNVVIFKDGSKGYETLEPVILQGHTDMVCQKSESSNINFETDGIKTYVDGDFLRAEETTLGADNGIAVAMVLAILESDDYAHPPIEAIFTSDEEIGMIGAGKLSLDDINAKRMINIDAEEPETLTVSCAGGSDFQIVLPFEKRAVSGKSGKIRIKGLKGGHSGVEIHKGRVNANILMGRILNYLNNKTELEICSVNGGDKANAITLSAVAELIADDKFEKVAREYIEVLKAELSAREPELEIEIEVGKTVSAEVITQKEKLIFLLACSPDGVMDMSAEIEGLVETSLNMGILKTEENQVVIHYALRSNKQSSLDALEEKLICFANQTECKTERFGHYPPWEFNDNSKLQKLYIESYKEKFGKEPVVSAIHAGLECGMFASRIENFDCIAIGPEILDAHTINERLRISSVQDIFEVIVKVLEKMK